MKWTLGIAMLSMVSACGGEEDGAEPADASTSTFDAEVGAADAMPTGPDAMPAGEFSLTSSAFASGGTIPTVHSCQGANTSPALSWQNPPSGTESFAIVFTDISTNFLHSVTWDIPSATTSIPADVDKTYEPADLPGAKQANGYSGTRGYAGPCPGRTHTYEFKLHAVNVATLPGVGEQTSGAAARAAIEAASLGFTTLEGVFDPG